MRSDGSGLRLALGTKVRRRRAERRGASSATARARAPLQSQTTPHRRTLRRIRVRLRGVVAAIAAHADSSRNTSLRQPRLTDRSVGQGCLREPFAPAATTGTGSHFLRCAAPKPHAQRGIGPKDRDDWTLG
jgi:hypothetical protein